MRKNYIDNLRVFCILLLFPFHTFMIYNNRGQGFYINGLPLKWTSIFNFFVYPWWMTLLFALAGISSAYALKSRSNKEFIKERVKRLLIPFLIGVVVIIPIQSYIADKFHNGYSGSYFQHYKIFFTKMTDFTGYDGGFTPAHLWFVLYLFIISLIMIPAINWYKNRDKKINFNKISLPMLLLLFLVILILTPILELGGQSLGGSLACFAIGFFILSLDEVLEKIDKNCILICLLFVAVSILRKIIDITMGDSGLIWDIVYRLVLWFGILAFLSLGKKFLNFSNKITKYLYKSAFSLYYFHQSFLVVIGFLSLKYINNIFLQISITMVGSLIMSLGAYELFRRFRITSFLFGIKQKRLSSE